MLPLGSKPSSESPLHSAQKAKSSLTVAYLTMPSCLPAPPPWPPHLPLFSLLAQPHGLSLHHTRHAVTSVPWQELEFPLLKRFLSASELINSLTCPQSSLKCCFHNEAHLTTPSKMATSFQSYGWPSSCASISSACTTDHLLTCFVISLKVLGLLFMGCLSPL